MRIAVMFNRSSGLGDRLLDGVAKDLVKAFKGHRLFASAGFGADRLGSSCRTVGVPSVRASSANEYTTALKEAVGRLVKESPDRFITVGGDGLAAYVADALIVRCEESGLDIPPVLGIAAGTANVGPIVSLPPSYVGSLRIDQGYVVRTGAVEVLDGEEHVGFGFNDVVIGDTLLSTHLGSMVNISAVELARNGLKMEKKPSDRIASKSFSISINGGAVKYNSRDPSSIKQIILSSLQFDDFYGRAITGTLCRAMSGADHAALALCDQVVVAMDEAGDHAPSLTGLQHITFKAGDRVTLGGLGEDAHIIIDGNPFIRQHDTLTFIYRPRLIPVWRVEAVHLRDPLRKEALV
ncbi:MAG: hypothetical protein ABIJ86_07905 [Spirochaetota bacterium]